MLREVTESRTLRLDAAETGWELRSCTHGTDRSLSHSLLLGDTVEDTDLPAERCSPRPQGGSDDLVFWQMES